MKMTAHFCLVSGLAMAALLSTAGWAAAKDQRDCAAAIDRACFLDSALVHARESTDPGRRTSLTIEIAALHAKAGDRDRAKGLFDEALAGLPEIHSPVERLVTLQYVARRLAESGFEAAALARLRDAAALTRRVLDRHEDPNRLGWRRSLASVAVSLADQGDRDGATAELRYLMTLIPEIDDPTRRITEYLSLAGPAAKRGLMEIAAEALETAWIESKRLDDSGQRLSMRISIAEEQWKAGMLEASRRHYEALKAAIEKDGPVSDRPGMLALVELRLYQVITGVRPE